MQVVPTPERPRTDTNTTQQTTWCYFSNRYDIVSLSGLVDMWKCTATAPLVTKDRRA